MAYDDRFGGEDRDRGRGDQWRSERDRGYGRDPHDRSPGSHVDYYRGGDRGQQRWGGDFESRDDYRRTDRFAEQGRASRRAGSGDDENFAESGRGYGGVGRDAGDFSEDEPGGFSGAYGGGRDFAGPRFDLQDPGHVGSHGVHPVASPFGGVGGTSGRLGTTSSARSRAILEQHERDQGRRYGQNEEMRGHSEYDPHYHEWRRRQIESLDRDYDEYRQENASRFESEFATWREKRGQQRQHMGRVTEHMEVVGSDGQHVGTVDKVRDGRIVLTKSDPSAGGHHHSIPCGWLESVDDKVTLNKSAEEAMQAWRDEETSRALFEREDSGSGGPHILERSFSGTYRDDR
ncbi:MAG: DUF2171 domain-containing protein [Allosphingosinicella sp.]|uniref:DUF2171 domain-containing protein n=1 Tax=Allosphingosinicella sp. TaxID=2823234 RepID=UPI00395129B3